MSTQKQCPEPALVFPCIISISIIFTGYPVHAQPYSFTYEWEGAMHTLLPLRFFTCSNQDISLYLPTWL